MKVTFDAQQLKQRLGQLGSVVARKSQGALYRNIRLFTDAEGVVNLQGIDIDTTMTLKVPSAKFDGLALNLLTEFNKLNEVLPNVTTKEVTIDSKSETEAILIAGKFRARLKAFPTAPFTDLSLVAGIADKPEIGGYVFGLPGLKEQIEMVDFAVPQAEGKHVVASALIFATATELSVVSTDGVRLVISTTPSDIGEFRFTVPKPALELLKKMEGGGKVTISDTEGAFYFETETELITYNKTHAEFPNYGGIVPKAGTYPTVVTFKDKAELVAAIGRQKPFCFSKDNPAVTFVFNGRDTVELVAVKEEVLATGNTYTDMTSDTITVEGVGDETRVKLDIELLQPFLERGTFPMVLHLNKPSNIADFHSNGGTPDKPTYRLLIMPMRAEGGATSTPMPPTE